GEKQIALKRLYYSNKANPDFWNELKRHRCKQNKFIPRCYGFSRDPATKDYVLVFEFVDGDLRHYLKKNFVDITWEKKLGIVYNIAHGLMTIHNAGLVHRNFHSGNILRHFNGSQSLTYISDLGQFRPSNNQDEDGIYGVLAYIAPEVLYGEPYTEASDVYSFSMIMWEIASGQRPFYERPHGARLAWDICNGLRPQIIVETPQCYIELMERCWNADPKQRPDIRELEKTLMSWGWHMGVSQKHSVSDQIISAEKERIRLLEHLGSQLEPFKKPHPESFYKSRLLNFPDLPTLRNIYDRLSQTNSLSISGMSGED
ncbi:17609_t:CDS:2, partial [Funneliformis geosporum]